MSCENTKFDTMYTERMRVMFFIIIVLSWIILNKSKEIFYTTTEK
jgi:hypothetical protein